MTRRNDPFREMYERMNRMFRDLSAETGLDVEATNLPVDIEETDDQVVVTADMPGIAKDNIHVQVRGDRLHLAAESETEVEEEGKDYVRRERSTRSYSRTVRLPAPVDQASAEATYDDGVLRIELDKLEKDGGTEIDVQ